MGECAESRRRIVRCHPTEEAIAIRFYCDGYRHPNFPEVEDAAVSHVRGCAACVAWIRRILPQSALRRAKRMGDYCCTRLYFACEEGSIVPRMRHGLVRGEEPCWYIEGKTAFAKFCPWCGTELPSQPFQEKQDRLSHQHPDPRSTSVTPPAETGDAPSVAASH